MSPERESARGGFRETFRILWPLVLGQAAGALMLFVDRTMLARHSDVAIQAALPAGVLSFTLVSFFHAVVSYSGTFAAQFFGAERHMSSAKALGQGVWLALLSAPLMALAMWPAHLFMEISGHAGEVLAAEKTYFNLLMAGAPAQTLAAAVCGYFAGRGRTRVVMASAVAGNILNIVLDYMLIFGKWGAPEMGIAGAAWATVAAQYAALLLPALLLAADPLVNTARRFAIAFRPDRALMLKILKYGAPSGIQGCIDMAVFTLFVMLTGRLTPMEFALSNIGFTINHLVFAPLYGFGQAANVLAGQHHGAGDHAATLRSCRSALVMALGYMALAAAFILTFHEPILGLFYGENTKFPYREFVDGGFALLAIAACWGVGDAIGLVVAGTLKGVGDTRFVMTMVVALNLTVWIPLFAFTMAYCPKAWAMWLTVPVFLFVDSAVCLIRLAKGKWRKIDMIS